MLRYRRFVRFAHGLAAMLLACDARAQNEDLVLPPRLDDEPYSARLAQQPEDRRSSLEEVIVVGENEWRLPDLGDTWRKRQEDKQEPARIQANFLPMYDPEDSRQRRDDLFMINNELRRVGFVELFKIRFGKRPDK